MTREEFRNTGWKCTYEEWQTFQCSTCTKANCLHRQAFRRVPIIDGGLGLCPRLMAYETKELKNRLAKAKTGEVK